MTAFNVLRVGFQLSAQDFEAFNNWDEQIVCVGTAAEFPTVNAMAPHLIDYTCYVSCRANCVGRDPKTALTVRTGSASKEMRFEPHRQLDSIMASRS